LLKKPFTRNAFLPSGSIALGDLLTTLLSSGLSTLPPQDIMETAELVRKALCEKGSNEGPNAAILASLGYELPTTLNVSIVGKRLKGIKLMSIVSIPAGINIYALQWFP